MQKISRPIFFIGVPRSGTTAIFEEFARHPDLAWLSNYSGFFPRLPIANVVRRAFENRWWHVVGRKDQFGELGLLNRFVPRPEESYEFWVAHANRNFDRQYLLGQHATPAEVAKVQLMSAKTMSYQGRSRFSAKLTGPGRITYLNSIFPDAIFIHLCRDGLDVVRSLMNVAFWRRGDGHTKPWWNGGLTEAMLARWRVSGSDPATLAAIQWHKIIETTRAEARSLDPRRYVECRYEDFVNNPSAFMTSIYHFVGLDESRVPPNALTIRRHHYDFDFDSKSIKSLVQLMEPTYSELGYPAQRGSSPLTICPTITLLAHAYEHQCDSRQHANVQMSPTPPLARIWLSRPNLRTPQSLVSCLIVAHRNSQC